MARNTRWTQIVHSFRAGILSPAAQDQIDGEAFLQGAARLDNLVVERDGGVAGRPAFVRSDVVIPKPRYGLLAGQQWRVDPGADVGDNRAGPATNRRSGRFSTEIYNPDSPAYAPRGIVPLRPTGAVSGGLTLLSYAADTSKDLLRIDLAEGLPRSVTFHGVTLLQGSFQGRASDDDPWRLNLVLVGKKRGQARLVRFDTEDPRSGVDENPSLLGKVAPGRIARDLVVRLIPRGEQRPADLEWIALRFARAGAAAATAPFQLEIQAVSVFCEQLRGGRSPNAQELPDETFDAPYRVIEWPIRNVPHVLALGMDWVSLFRVEGSRLVRFQGDDARTRGVWHFTERQLAELTATRFGGNLLLFHREFPFPLEVRLAEKIQDPLTIRALALENLAVLTADQSGRIAPQISDQVAVQQVAADAARIPGLVNYLSSAFAGGLRVTWGATGADAYRVYWVTRQNFLNEGGTL